MKLPSSFSGALYELPCFNKRFDWGRSATILLKFQLVEVQRSMPRPGGSDALKPMTVTIWAPEIHL